MYVCIAIKVFRSVNAGSLGLASMKEHPKMASVDLGIGDFVGMTSCELETSISEVKRNSEVINGGGAPIEQGNRWKKNFENYTRQV